MTHTRFAKTVLCILSTAALLSLGCDRPRWSATEPAEPPVVPDGQVTEGAGASRSCETSEDHDCCDSSADCPDGYGCSGSGVCIRTTRTDDVDPVCDGDPTPMTDPEGPAITRTGVCAGKLWSICDADSGLYRPPTTLDEIANPAGSEIAGFEPIESSCDGEDNDCDGETDESTVTTGESSRWLLGVCADLPVVKVKICRAGEEVEPSPDEVRDAAMRAGVPFEYEPKPDGTLSELACDGRDNDCDGTTDEAPSHDRDGNPLTLGASCFDGDPASFRDNDTAICQSGARACVGGDVLCEGQVLPADAETCLNLLDDDCDGQVDEGCVGGPCRADADCPSQVMAEGADGQIYTFDVTCDTGAIGGACVMPCPCRGCVECVLDLDDDQDPDVLCRDECLECNAARDACDARAGVCGQLQRADESFTPACLRDCNTAVATGECREGYSCVNLGGQEGRRACYSQFD